MSRTGHIIPTLIALAVILASPGARAQTPDEMQKELRAIQERLNQAARTGQGLEELYTPANPGGRKADRSSPEPRLAAPTDGEPPRSPLEKELRQLSSGLMSRSYYDARQALQLRGYRMANIIRSNADVIERCPIGSESACNQFREAKRCWQFLTLQCDMAWSSPGAGEPDVVVTVAFGDFGLPLVNGIQTAAARSAEQISAGAAASARQAEKQTEEENRYVNIRQTLLQSGFTPAHDNGGDGPECKESGNPSVCRSFRENSACVADQYCTFEWSRPDKGRVRVTTDAGWIPARISVTNIRDVY